jgi:peptidoglycan hydrolase-like protein with peptidoglycan-binding domain
MHRSKPTSGSIVGSSVAAILSLTGVALAEGNDGVKKDPATQQKASNAEHTMRSDDSRDAAIVGSADQIKELQRELASRGFYQGNIDGVAGAKTRAALRNFQVQQGISTDGGLNVQTRDSLGLEWERQPVKGTDSAKPEMMRGNERMQGTRTQAAPQPQPQRAQNQPVQTQAGTDNTSVRVNLSALNAEQTKEIQQKLQQLGFYQGTIDGKFGAGTRAALTRYFQRQAQLASQGMVDDSAIGVFGIEASDVKPVSGENWDQKKSAQ